MSLDISTNTTSPTGNLSTETTTTTTTLQDDEQIISKSSINTSTDVESSSSNSNNLEGDRTDSPSAAAFLPTIPITNSMIDNNSNETKSTTEEEQVVNTTTLANEEEEESSTSAQPVVSMKGKENRSLDAETHEDQPELSAGKPQGRAFTNFVTVAPATGDSPSKAKIFDLSDVSLEDHPMGSEEATAAAKKTPAEVTCRHEGNTFKVRKLSFLLQRAFNFVWENKKKKNKL